MHSNTARVRTFVLSLSIIFSVGQAFSQAERPNTFAAIAKRVEPAVVSIDTKSKVAEPRVTATPAPGASDDIMEFFRRQMQARPVYGIGSGFIVDKAGYIVTNAHVVGNTANITVKLDTGEEYPAKIVGADDETDIAILKIDARRELPFLKFGSSTKAEVGDWVLAVGSPFGLAKSVTAGIISQKDREGRDASAFRKFIQTDAAINPGNSGGPLVNMDGEVIGINSQIATATGEYSGVGFALPSDQAVNVYEQIVKSGKVRRGYLGAYLDSVKGEFARVYGLPEAKGAIITDIRDKQSAAAVAGLQNGDIVVEFNGAQVHSAGDLIAKVAATPPDQAINIKYLREAGSTLETRTASIKLGERPSGNRFGIDDGEPRKLPISAPREMKPFGLTLEEITPALAEKYSLGTNKGIVVREINPASFIADVKNSVGADALGEGDLIQRINRQSVTDVKSFNTAVSALKPGDAVVLHVLEFNGQLRGIQLKVVQFTVR
jgi:serine protease Do